MPLTPPDRARCRNECVLARLVPSAKAVLLFRALPRDQRNRDHAAAAAEPPDLLRFDDGHCTLPSGGGYSGNAPAWGSRNRNQSMLWMPKSGQLKPPAAMHANPAVTGHTGLPAVYPTVPAARGRNAANGFVTTSSRDANRYSAAGRPPL